MKKLCLIAILLLIVAKYGQSQQVELSIIDNTSGIPISNCRAVAHDGKELAVADEEGVIKFVTNSNIAKFDVTKEGYASMSIPTYACVGKKLQVLLTPKEAIKKKNRLKKMGITCPHVNGYTSLNLAQFIPNKKGSNNLNMEKVVVYILDRGYGNASPLVPFYVTLYTGDGETPPTVESRLTLPILCQATKGNEYFELDISALNIKMPTSGVFVELSGVGKELSEEQTIEFPNTDIKMNYNRVMLEVGESRCKVNTYNTWGIFEGEQNYKRIVAPKKDVDGNIIELYNPMIYIEVNEL